MDDLVERLKAGTVIVETHGALAPMAWAEARRSDLVDGVIAVVEDQEGRIFAYIPREGGPALVLPVSSIVGVFKQTSAFNTVVDVAVVDEGEAGTICLVGPRGRIKKISAAVGHPV